MFFEKSISGLSEIEWVLLVIFIVALLMSGAVGFLGIDLTLIVLVISGVGVILLKHPAWGVVLYFVLSPLSYLVRPWVPGAFQSVWRDVLILVMVAVWLFKILAIKSRPGMKVDLDLKIVLMICFGIFVSLQILRSDSLLVGLVGFRILFRCFPGFFVALFFFANKWRVHTMRLFSNAFLIGAFINTLAGALQFLTISLLEVIPPGSWIDPIRGASGFAATRWGMYRALGFFSDPNDFGQILVVSLALMLPRTLRQNGNPYFRMYRLAIVVVLFAIVGTLAAFAIFPAMLILLLFFSALTSARLRTILTVLSFISILLVGLLLLDPSSEFTWMGYTSKKVVNSFSYIPRAIKNGDVLGQGYGVYSSLAERLGISEGSTANRGTYWFYLDQITPQIGLFGVFLWLVLWGAFMYASYRNLFQASQLSSLEFRSHLAVWLALVGLFISSLHYGPYRVGGVDLMVYVLWAFVSASEAAKSK